MPRKPHVNVAKERAASLARQGKAAADVIRRSRARIALTETRGARPEFKTIEEAVASLYARQDEAERSAIVADAHRLAHEGERHISPAEAFARREPAQIGWTPEYLNLGRRT